MSSTFGGIQQASNAIATARYGLEIVNQNIANATTPGYTRQSAQQAAVDSAAGVPSLYTRPAGPGGVTVSGTVRMNDPVLDARSRTEHARTALADTSANQLSQVEAIFPEPGDTGLADQLGEFWNSWASVANDPGSAAPRTVLLQKAATVTSTLNAMSTSLSNVSASAAQSLDENIASVNSAAGQLADVNAQIAIASATGTNANSLLDQRDQLLDQLGNLVGATATINPNGSADVSVAGQALVTGPTAGTISRDPSYQVSVGGTAVTLAGGSAAASVATILTVVPDYQSQLNSVADTLSSVVNGAQTGGFDLAGNAGTALFSGAGAANIHVAITDPDQIAASGAPGGNLDGSNALDTSKLGTGTSAPDALYSTLIGKLGSASALAQQQQTTQDAVSSSVDSLRQSVSGVSLDEEVSNLLTYQRAFQASSRVLTTIDSMLDTLINHTGMVGLT